MIRLTSGCAQLDVDLEHGGRLASLRVVDRELLRPPSESLLADPSGWALWGCYTLAPWSNRIPNGRLILGDKRYRLPRNWSDGSSLHGLVAARRWQATWMSGSSAVLTTRAKLNPYDVSVSERVSLTSAAVRLDIEMTNDGDRPVPAGLGIHPWLAPGPIRVPATHVWPAVDSIPTGNPVPVDDETDLRRRRVPPSIDACYTGLTGDSVDVGDVSIRWEGPITQIVVCTTFPGWVAVEPVTMATGGFELMRHGVNGHGVHVVDPGGSLAVGYDLLW